MDLKKLDLKDRINELEKELKEAKKHTYIYESHTLQVWDGELHIGYGDLEDEKSLVWNVESLFKDLPFLINQVVKENKKMQKMYLDMTKKELKEL